jgi:hypothetical protein
MKFSWVLRTLLRKKKKKKLAFAKKKEAMPAHKEEEIFLEVLAAFDLLACFQRNFFCCEVQ